MENKYYITDYFEKNNLFDSNDDLTLINKESDYKEIIIEKDN